MSKGRADIVTLENDVGADIEIGKDGSDPDSSGSCTNYGHVKRLIFTDRV
ncbi:MULTISPECIES: hypothetical protein [Halococcus]|nr:MULTISPECIES: hypothetical protein [Halococcus]